MHLISFIFRIPEDDHPEFVQTAYGTVERWQGLKISCSLFRDKNDPLRFYLLFLTEKSIEEITELIHSESWAKSTFEIIKNSSKGVEISFFEQVF